MVRTQTLRYWIGQQQKSFYMQWRPSKKEALQHHAVSDQYRLFFVGVANQNSCLSQTHQTNCIQVSLLRCFWGVKRPGLSGKPHIDIIDVEWLVLDATRGESGALGKAFWFGTFHCCFFWGGQRRDASREGRRADSAAWKFITPEVDLNTIQYNLWTAISIPHRPVTYIFGTCGLVTWYVGN